MTHAQLDSFASALPHVFPSKAPKDACGTFDLSADAALALLGPSPAMARLCLQIRRVAPYARMLVMTGEPHCGQIAVAKLVLELSPDPRRSFLQLTAAQIEARLVRKDGLATLPADAFLYLPDADRLSLPAQEALLRLARLRRSRLFTIVAATSDELHALSATKQVLPEFAKLFSSVQMELPPLHKRPEDLPMLVTHALAELCRVRGLNPPQVTPSFLRAAMEHMWPGNLAEFSAVLCALCADQPAADLHAEDLHAALGRPAQEEHRRIAPARLVPLHTVMSEHIVGVLGACRGNKLRAAEVLGISRSTLYRMLEAAKAGRPEVLHAAV